MHLGVRAEELPDPIPDEAALIKAVHTKGIWAGVDVVENEPDVEGPFRHPFAAEENILVTQHTPSATRRPPPGRMHHGDVLRLHGDAAMLSFPRLN
ncbi:hypothetical protein PAPYR_7636 [Paratrimastix pyriformis]|uniref:D-isomer specific 2-hydroxyacid dehydrogenase NAD-binding domain-containing protein n=1 Tax=Paratrimastix pyriformis TaxID=342808 RepID=A0ABQ8UHT4_9EUKA|nr:hypothetical protein PAPYR_7636 [Paratrimastix pyriformis]